MSLADYLYVGFDLYLVPFLMTIGVIYFIYGIIEYFIIEGEQQHGRELFLKAILWFTAALVIYVIVMMLNWMIGAAQNIGDDTSTGSNYETDTGSGGAGRINSEERILRVPDVPGAKSE